MPKVCSKVEEKKPSVHHLITDASKLKQLRGDPIDMNRHRHLLQAFDSRACKLYLCGQGKESSSSLELHAIDIQTKRIIDLSTQLRHWEPRFSLCASQNTGAAPRTPLPRLNLPSITFMNLNSVNYVVLFGGEEIQNLEGIPSADLILIDVDGLRWWREPVEGLIRPRVGAAFTAFDGKIFIFGGHERVYPKAGPFLKQLSSYSVLEFNTEKGRWVAIRADIPYPRDVIGDLAFKDAIPVYNGKQIFLTPAHSEDSIYKSAELTPDNLCFFDSKHFMFQVIKFLPSTIFPETLPPRNVDKDFGIPALNELVAKPEPERLDAWLKHMFVENTESEIPQLELWMLYKDTFSASAGTFPIVVASDVITYVRKVFPRSHIPSPSDRPDGLGKYVVKGIERKKVTVAIKYTYHPIYQRSPELSLAESRSILIAGSQSNTIEGTEPRESVSELWRLSLFPDSRIAYLNVSDELQNAGASLRHVVVVDQRVHLFGNKDTENWNSSGGTSLLNSVFEVPIISQ